MFTIKIPAQFSSEIKWVLNHVFQLRLGVRVQPIESESRGSYVISDGRKKLTISNDLFGREHSEWPSVSALPKLPLLQWDTREIGVELPFSLHNLPLLFGSSGFHIDRNGDGYLGLDVVGSAYFMLSRIEELFIAKKDVHDRVPATESVAYKAEFIDRPIIDEYIEVLWAAMKRVWPDMERRTTESRIVVSCDVDSPYLPYSRSMNRTARVMVGDVVKRGSLLQAARTLEQYLRMRRGDYSRDPLMSPFEWMMDVNERAGNRVTFNFMAGGTHPVYDGRYSLDDPVIRNLMRDIYARGHEVGFHGSYFSYRDEEQVCYEVCNLRRVMEEVGIKQELTSGRQHYLRWKTPDTARDLAAAGLMCDCSVGYADHAGFRCGTCHEYNMFDPVKRVPLHIRQRPLVMMECSVLDKPYMGYGASHEALDYMNVIKERCYEAGGYFTILWHNSRLRTGEYRKLYQAILT